MPGHKLDWEAKPDLYKEYPQAQKIELPSFEPARAMSLDKTLRQRKSIRDFQARPLSKGQLAYLLWASTGIQRVEDGYEFRTAPSAGALYPIETYVVVNNVKSLEPGVYHYQIRSHQLEQQRRSLSGPRYSNAANGSTANVRIVIFISTQATSPRTSLWQPSA